MVFVLTFKTPDVLEELEDQFNGEVEDAEQALILAQRFVEHQEYIRIQFDTQTGAATVLPVNHVSV